MQGGRRLPTRGEQGASDMPALTLPRLSTADRARDCGGFRSQDGDCRLRHSRHCPHACFSLCARTAFARDILMADDTPHGPVEMGAEMDYAEHDKTYHRFLML